MSKGILIGEAEGELLIRVPLHSRSAEVAGVVAAGVAAPPAKLLATDTLVANAKLGIQHTKNCTMVKWGGETFSFTTKQSLVVLHLIDAMSEGVEWLDQYTLLECAESDCDRLYRLFRGHPAWGRWIVPAASISHKPATFRLEKPI